MKTYRTILLGAVTVVLTMVVISYVAKDLNNYNGKTINFTPNDFQENEEKAVQKTETLLEPINAQIRQNDDVDWRSVDVNALTPDQLHDYMHWTNRSSCNLIHDFGGFMLNRTTLQKMWGGKLGFWKSLEKIPVAMDGQYPICLDPIPPTPGNCLVYSFGINNEWSFDQAFDTYGCQVYSFDASIGLKHFDKTPNIHFYDWFLGSKDENNKTLTLSSIYNMLAPKHGQVVIDYLKIDIEFNEWHVLPQIVQSGMLKKVRQLAIEAHIPPGKDLEFYRKNIVGTIKSIEDTGMVRFDSRYTPFCALPIVEMNSPYNCFQLAWYNPDYLPAKVYYEI